MTSYDTIVIGGGVAGLLTALRLARAGQAVALLEADQLGSGATCANHGMLHSGALYARRHPHVVANCRQAQAAFTTLLPAAELPTQPAVYVVHRADADGFRSHLDQHGIAHQPGATHDLATDANGASGGNAYQLVQVAERVFSSWRIVTILAGQALAASVTVCTGVTVQQINHESGKVTGVALSTGERLAGRTVVVAAGIGTATLLRACGSRDSELLKSRLDMMIHLPATTIRQGLIFTELHRPVLMPARDGGTLTSYFGGTQPDITGRRAYAVDLDKATALLEQTRRACADGVVDPTGAVAYVAGKTDYIGTAHAEHGRINPGFHVIHHEHTDGIHGLHTVITGKMTLAFHASKAAADAILGTDLPLLLTPATTVDVPQALVAVEPWAPTAHR
ncbi:FAD-dependent oxidoreductase [Dactylosporangium vinaceum]|uniref:NAD(P)/FAD-dependent oxidoreductase n=1 Tax=Dactylosporangium vinaceum TaxID=53362 RepID=A0ABV5M2T8_9ACTN|nr:FAD-dependent oxidoreductase [Dactylosporangium vinaceum]UAB96337.1 FAD-dependent oxidoreductase [Dactylosporangium vinaceum]